MSVAAMKWAMDHAPAYLTSGERFVLLVLADYVGDDTREAWPSVHSLARRTGLSTRAVQRALRTLEQAYIIRTERQAGGSRHTRDDRRTNLYRWQPEKAMRHRPGGDVMRLDGQVEVVALSPDQSPTVIALPELTAAAIAEATGRQGDAPVEAVPLAVDNSPPGATPCHPVDPNGVTLATPRGDTVSSEPLEEPPTPTWSPSNGTVTTRAGERVPVGDVDLVTGEIHEHPRSRPRRDAPEPSREQRTATYSEGAASARRSLLEAIASRQEGAAS